MLSESSTGLEQGVEFSGALEEIEPSERGDDSLLDLAVEAFVVDDLKILIATVLCDSGEPGVRRCAKYPGKLPLAPVAQRATVEDGLDSARSWPSTTWT